MNEIRQLKDIPFGYMITKNDCENCIFLEHCTYQQLAVCFYLKNKKDLVSETTEEE